jgi:XTP/dITP diphosphohydrolase
MEISFLTGNSGKFKEIARKIEGKGITLEMEEADFTEVQADTLEEVVISGMKLLKGDLPKRKWLIKDDSGLFIDSLKGFPGVYSAYVHRTIGNEGILDLMNGRKERGASFRTVIGLNIPDKGLSLFRGECRGRISLEEKGRQGFGFDPVFIPDGHGETFAQMGLDEKNEISHRTKALARMMDFLNLHYL